LENVKGRWELRKCTAYHKIMNKVHLLSLQSQQTFYIGCKKATNLLATKLPSANLVEILVTNFFESLCCMCGYFRWLQNNAVAYDKIHTHTQSHTVL